MILQRLKDQFRQNWSSDIQNSNSCWNYRLFKTIHKLENYLIKLPPSLWHHLCKFRTGNTRLPIVIGRYDNTEREDRLCSFCNSGIGDEFHYIFKCSHFNQERASLFDTSVITSHNPLIMHSLFNSTTLVDMKNLASFTKLVLNSFR